MFRQGIVGFLLAVALGACAGTNYTSPREITGNNTGGVIPPALAEGADVQSLANTHCAKWGYSAQITFDQAQFGGEVVFICVGPGGQPTWIQPETPQGESQGGDVWTGISRPAQR